ncbi:redoxin domain-containing protein [Nesterenkonia sp. Act20]|uniref:redoxin domain-containing protein n=1 Tax=Nesterenkonia sp. Act20 TaxID=1483432 RepID=UPI001C45A7D2|nr:redoxin domain-containing protein [Nesterenkonia sp. Act20]
MTATSPPELGERAPSFSARTHHGESITLEHLGGAPALLMFYPFAFSAVCGSELRSLALRSDEIREIGATVLAISCDSLHSLRAYAESLRIGGEELPFSLVSDFWPHGQMAGSFGVFDSERGTAQRTSVLLDPQLRVAHLQSVPNAQARNLDETLSVLAGLRGRS